MNKEKIEKSGYEEYQEKLQLIKGVADNFNKEFNLEGEDQITFTPDQLSIPLIHKDGKRAWHMLGVFEGLVSPIKSKDGQGLSSKSTTEIIRSLLKYGKEFDSDDNQVIRKCLEKFKQRTKE